MQIICNNSGDSPALVKWNTSVSKGQKANICTKKTTKRSVPPLLTNARVHS